MIIDKFIQEYNSLDNKKVDRKTLEAINSKALLLASVHPSINEIFAKTKAILDNSDKEYFKITLHTKISSNVKGLNKQEIKGLGVPYMETPQEEAVGLNGKISQADIYQMITDQMLEMIEKASGKDWVKSWKANPFVIPHNYITKKPYRGINHNLLTLFGFRSFENPFFLTFKQVNKLKGRIKKGSKGFPVIYYTRLYIYESQEEGLKIGTYDIKKFKAFLYKNKSKISLLKKFSIDDIVEQSYLPIIKYYMIYNGKDIEGIDFNLEEYAKAYARNDGEKLEAAEAIIKNFPAPIPPLKHGGDGAFYSPIEDYVQMPTIQSFDTELDYYRTLFHEYIHASGHHKRLDRLTPSSFGSPEYAKEELVAEFGAVFLSAEAGIIWRTNKNHAEYLKNWKNALKHIEKDNKLILRASSAAQKATDYILQRDKEGTALYLKKLKKKISQKSFSFQFKKLISSQTIFNHVKKGYNLKISDADLSKSYAYAKLAKYILTHARYFPKYKGSKLLSEAGDTKLFKSLKSEIKRRNLTVEVSIVIPLPKINKAKQYELGLKAAGEVVIDFTEENIATTVPTTTVDSSTTVVDLVDYPSTTPVKPIKQPSISINKPSTVVASPVDSVDSVEKHQENKLIPYKVQSPNPSPIKVNKKTTGRSLHDRAAKRNRNYPLYNIPNKDIAKFLGDVEIKNKESVVITLAGEQGSGKTRFLFQLMNALAKNYKVGHASMEEHPDSKLYLDKEDQYIDDVAYENISNPEVTTLSQLDKMIRDNDIIFIDSFAKLRKIDKKITLDEDLRKKYDGKLFVIIYQLTGDGKMRGGSDSQFDGDIILFVKKEDDYRDSYVYANKNRYQTIPLNKLQFNIYRGELNDLAQEENPEENNEEFVIEIV